MALPDEPEIMDARLPFWEAQEALAGLPEREVVTYSTLSWYGTDYDENRGCFAIVDESGPLADLVGDRLRLRYFLKSVNVYCIGARDVPDDYDIVIPRRPYAALELLAVDRIEVIVETLIGGA